jgi:hypothetical protein
MTAMPLIIVFGRIGELPLERLMPVNVNVNAGSWFLQIAQ